MWIVVVLDYYYPSVFHFEEELAALDLYNEYKEYGFLVHLARIESSTLNINKQKNSEKEDVFNIKWC